MSNTLENSNRDKNFEKLSMEEVMKFNNIQPRTIYKGGEAIEKTFPSHYTWFEEKFGIKSRKILEQFTFNIGSAMKYLIRHGRKKSMSMDERTKAIDDLKKAIDFINFEIERIGGE